MTEEQKAYVRQHFANTQSAKIAAALGVKLRAVTGYAEYYNSLHPTAQLRKSTELRQAMGRRQLAFIQAARPTPTATQIADLKRLFPVMKNRELAARIGLPIHTVERLSREYGLVGTKSREAVAGLSVPWTVEEVALMRREFPICTTADLARRLGRSEFQVGNKARRMGLAKDWETMRQLRAERLAAQRAAMGAPGRPPKNKEGKRIYYRNKGRGLWVIWHNGQPVAEHRLRWGAVNGPIPHGVRLVCLDGNHLNTDPSNWRLPHTPAEAEAARRERRRKAAAARPKVKRAPRQLEAAMKPAPKPRKVKPSKAKAKPARPAKPVVERPAVVRVPQVRDARLPNLTAQKRKRKQDFLEGAEARRRAQEVAQQPRKDRGPMVWVVCHDSAKPYEVTTPAANLQNPEWVAKRRPDLTTVRHRQAA